MSSTLQNFGIPDGEGGGRGGILMPKVKWKFRVRCTNFGIPSSSLELTQQVMQVGRPVPTFAEGTVHSYNSTAYYAGKSTWAPIDLDLRDDVTNSVSSLVGAQLQKQMNYFNQTTPLSAGNYKFQMLIETLDGGNDTVLETWQLEGCYLNSATYDTFDYSSSDVMTIKLNIRFDNATQEGGLMPLVPIQSTSNGGLNF